MGCDSQSSSQPSASSDVIVPTEQPFLEKPVHANANLDECGLSLELQDKLRARRV
jgi:hypothetical protein